jgi:hypothetical protein
MAVSVFSLIAVVLAGRVALRGAAHSGSDGGCGGAMASSDASPMTPEARRATTPRSRPNAR